MSRTRQVFFLDSSRQPPKPRPLDRGCVDIAALWLGTLLGAIIVLYGVYALLFDNSVSNWPIVVVSLAGILSLLVHPIGEIILWRNWPVLSYVYFSALVYTTLAFLWVVTINFVYTKQVNTRLKDGDFKKGGAASFRFYRTGA
jgi:hypothetical protein